MGEGAGGSSFGGTFRRGPRLGRRRRGLGGGLGGGSRAAVSGCRGRGGREWTGVNWREGGRQGEGIGRVRLDGRLRCRDGCTEDGDRLVVLLG